MGAPIYQGILPALPTDGFARMLERSAVGEAGYLPTLGRAAHGVIYVTWSGSCTAGVVTIEEAPAKEYTGTWATIAAVSFSQANAVDAIRLAHGVYGSVRARITTAIAGGTVTIEGTIQE